jgi:hypothetical protein
MKGQWLASTLPTFHFTYSLETVIPAKAGIQFLARLRGAGKHLRNAANLGSGLRRNDVGKVWRLFEHYFFGGNDFFGVSHFTAALAFALTL